MVGKVLRERESESSFLCRSLSFFPVLARPGSFATICHSDDLSDLSNFQTLSGKMDPEIWSQLPQEMLLDVLARLPYDYIPRLREVCKRWKELLVAKYFTDRIVSVRKSQTPFLLVCVKRFQAIVAYNPARREWREVFIWKKSPNFYIHSLRAAGGGLLCFEGNVGRKREDGDIRLLICNPISKLWRILPPLPSGIKTSGCVNLVVLENEPNQFKILFTQIHQLHGQRRLVGTLFDSLTDSWTTHSEDTTLESIYRSVYVNGSMHYIGSERVHEDGTLISRRQGVSFDLLRKVFSRFEAPLASVSVGAKKFMELHDKLSLVTFSTVPTFSPSVQQFDDQTGTWVEVHVLPPGTTLGVQGHVPLGQGSYLYFADPRRSSFNVICYDLLNRERFDVDEAFLDLRSEGYKLYHPSLCSV
uniref:F-box domain-containing protein n=2 Tax=Physcomitrium patens TaxID=3218 RepID=A0A2K1KLE8_PHYPA|nr:F-box/kelch-repeat protein At5g15710-like isoform X1 [Physcomitrium patens]PNR54599.1 hypothetical protein PHYPA_008276 [Physcomitrium patens]|eukprot:XP_024375479.1 F-box/kelch-repeat protein At5g15710-like isoform X1 [Physcomitrella patens]